MSASKLEKFKYIILGGGNASGYAANQFDKNGLKSGELCIITNEPVEAYERPALSKAYLAPEKPARLPGFHTCVGVGEARQDIEWYKNKGIEYKVNTKIESVDIKAKKLVANNGNEYIYEKLIIATGARPVYLSDFKIPGSDLEGIYYLRDVTDGRKLLEAMSHIKENSGKVVVVGGGYIGMECAAGLINNGLDVTMIFPEPYMMQRLFVPQVAEIYENFYISKGVKFHKGRLAAAIEGDNGKVTCVKLTNGDKLPADLVLVGTGARANIELFKDQLEIAAGGIKVDAYMKTSDPDVYAIGDVAAFQLKMYGGEPQRQEHVTNCRLSARHAVNAITKDSKEEYDYLPFFYSRIFHFHWKFYGKNIGETIFFGSADSNKFGMYWIDEGKVVGAFLEGGTAEEDDAMAVVARNRPEAPSINDLEKLGTEFAVKYAASIT